MAPIFSFSLSLSLFHSLALALSLFLNLPQCLPPMCSVHGSNLSIGRAQHTHMHYPMLKSKPHGHKLTVSVVCNCAQQCYALYIDLYAIIVIRWFVNTNNHLNEMQGEKLKKLKLKREKKQQQQRTYNNRIRVGETKNKKKRVCVCSTPQFCYK